jgi:hypothetical protein
VAAEAAGAGVTDRVDERTAWLRELVPLLWPAPATATLGRARHANARRSYLILPSLAHPRLLVPRRTRRAAGGALRGYGEQSSAARRLAVRLAAAGLTAGAGDSLLRDRLEVGGGGDTIEDQLSRELGRPVLVSLHLGPARANRKPVLQLLGADGGTVGYAKVATNVLTGRLVADEVAALRTLAGAGLTRVTVPRVLSGGSWRGLEILVQSPLPVRQPRRPADGRLAPATAEVAAVGGISAEPVDGPYGSRLRQRVAALPAGEARDGLTAALDTLDARAELRIGSWHGDWTPWNTAVVEGTVLAWDWERFASGVPAGFDALHYDLQPRLTGEPRTDGLALADLGRRAPGLLAPVGVPAESAAVVAVLYLVEILTRYIGDGQTRWGNWRSLTEGVLAAARAAAPVPAR